MRASLALSLLFAGSLVAASREEYDAAKETVMVAMRDGVKLATDVYRPARNGAPIAGQLPVIVYRTPYNKDGIRGDGTWFARRGYVVVAQDCRGRFASEGGFYPFLNEGKDGHDTIEWASSQPWSNGKVGTNGGSYLAWDQYHAAMYRPVHLVAMFAVVGGANFLEEFGHPGGAPNLGWPTWLLSSAQSSPQAARNPELAKPLDEIRKDPIAWLKLPPAKRAEAFANFPDQGKAYQDLYQHPEFDSYWKQRGWHTSGYHREMKDVPIYFISGWYDYFVEGVLENFSGLNRIQKTPKKLQIGPWPHGIGRSECGDGSFGDAAQVDQRELALDWFDHWMKDDPFDKIGAEPVRVFRMGGGSGKKTPSGKLDHGGSWQSLSNWPAPASSSSRYYLADRGALSTSKPLAATASFVYDPENPVPTIGGRPFGGVPACAQNQAPLNGRADILTFMSDPLTAPVDVTGKIRARLSISSDAPDTDFTAKLIDVYPDGYALILADGIIRTRYRNGQTKSEMMKSGKTYEVPIDLGSTSNLFATGHRIRVDVSSSNFPHREPNPNTGEPADRWTRRVKARNTVHLGASYVELPVRTP